MTHHRPVLPPCPVALAWLGLGGRVRDAVRDLPPSPMLDAATAHLGRGTPLRGRGGPVPVEDVRPGDEIGTAHGWARVVWTAARDAPSAIRVARCALGAGPQAPIVLGYGALVLLEDERCRLLVGARRAFAPLAALEDGVRVARVEPKDGTPMHALAFAAQGAVCASGIGVAAAHPAHALVGSPLPGAVAALPALFPNVAAGGAFGRLRTAMLSHAEARGLIEAGGVQAAACGLPDR